MLGTTPDFINSTNRVQPQSTRHQKSVSYVWFLPAPLPQNSPLSNDLSVWSRVLPVKLQIPWRTRVHAWPLNTSSVSAGRWSHSSGVCDGRVVLAPHRKWSLGASVASTSAISVIPLQLRGQGRVIAHRRSHESPTFLRGGPLNSRPALFCCVLVSLFALLKTVFFLPSGTVSFFLFFWSCLLMKELNCLNCCYFGASRLFHFINSRTKFQK